MKLKQKEADRMKAGKLPELVLGRSVLKKIRNKREEVIIGAKAGNDAAVMRIPGELVTACAGSSSMNYIPELPVDSEGYLESVMLNAGITAVRAVNSISAEGGNPFALLVTMILPENFEEPQVKKVMDVFEEVSRSLNLQIAGGHSEVSAHVVKPVFAVTAYGSRTGQPPLLREKKVLYGQDIIMTGYMASEGTAVLAKLQKDSLGKRFTPSYLSGAAEHINELSVMDHAAIAVRNHVSMMHDLSETGVFGGLWELGEKMRTGMEVNLRMIPVRQETIELSEYMELNPYALPSGGSMLMVAENGNDLVRELKKYGIPAAVIGKVMEGNDKVIINHDERRFLEQPR